MAFGLKEEFDLLFRVTVPALCGFVVSGSICLPRKLGAE